MTTPALWTNLANTSGWADYVARKVLTEEPDRRRTVLIHMGVATGWTFPRVEFLEGLADALRAVPEPTEWWAYICPPTDDKARPTPPEQVAAVLALLWDAGVRFICLDATGDEPVGSPADDFADAAVALGFRVLCERYPLRACPAWARRGAIQQCWHFPSEPGRFNARAIAYAGGVCAEIVRHETRQDREDAKGKEEVAPLDPEFITTRLERERRLRPWVQTFAPLGMLSQEQWARVSVVGVESSPSA